MAAQTPSPSGTPADENVDALLRDYALTHRADLRERLIVLHLDLVSRQARQLAGRGQLMDDLIQVGYIGLMKAIDRYEPDRKVAFAAYAIPTISGEMRRYLRDKEPIIHVPRQIQEQRRAVHQATDELTQRLHRPPTEREIADALDWNVQRVHDVHAADLTRPISLDQPVGEGHEEMQGLQEVIALDDQSIQQSEDRALLQRVVRQLTPRQRAILYLLFYEDLSQAAIGERLSISQMHVSRLCRAALERLRAGLEDHQLDQSA